MWISKNTVSMVLCIIHKTTGLTMMLIFIIYIESNKDGSRILLWGDENVYTKHKIHNLHIKYNTNFNFKVTNLYNLKVIIINITITLRFLI